MCRNEIEGERWRGAYSAYSLCPVKSSMEPHVSIECLVVLKVASTLGAVHWITGHHRSGLLLLLYEWHWEPRIL